MFLHIYGSQKTTYDTSESITPFVGEHDILRGQENRVQFYDFDSFYKKCHKSGQDAYFFMQLFLATQGDPGLSSSTQKIQILPVLQHLGHFKCSF